MKRESSMSGLWWMVGIPIGLLIGIPLAVSDTLRHSVQYAMVVVVIPYAIAIPLIWRATRRFSR